MILCEKSIKSAQGTLMARLGIDYDTVKQAAIKLLSQGEAPSVQKIRDLLGTGSNTTIAEHLKTWREEHAKKTVHYLPDGMPKELIATFEVLWQTAMEQAQNQLTVYKSSLENEHNVMLQKQKEAEKTVEDLKYTLAGISARLDVELSEKQRINTELAIANERIAKQTELAGTEINGYEVRLKRIYEEKDALANQQLQSQHEIKNLQEKLHFQTEQHHILSAQQNALHEQSEARWLNLIDQTKQEAKDAYKKHENFKHRSDEQIEKITASLSSVQQDLSQKNAQLLIAQEQNELLKKENRIFEDNHTEAMRKWEEQNTLFHTLQTQYTVLSLQAEAAKTELEAMTSEIPSNLS